MNFPAIDPRIRRFLPPTRVLWSQNAENAPVLLANNWGQALAQPAPSCRMRGQNAGILLDFGRELHGALQLVIGPIEGNKAVRAQLRLGESASEAMGSPTATTPTTISRFCWRR